MRSYYEDEDDEYSYGEMMLMRRGDPSSIIAHRPLTSSTNHMSTSSYIQPPAPVSRANSEDSRFDSMCLEDLDIIKTIGKLYKA